MAPIGKEKGEKTDQLSGVLFHVEMELYGRGVDGTRWSYMILI